jgi:putative ABC transport system substrate-binding protein
MLLGGVAAWSGAARAEQPVIGLLGLETPEVWADRLRTFRQGLSEVGFIEGKNVTIEYRWAGRADEQREHLLALATDLVRREVSVIVTFAGPFPALVAKAATTTIPILFLTSTDPVQTGLVTSLNRPGGNLTGVTTMNTEVGPKRLELLHELVPQATLFGVLINLNSSTNDIQLKGLAEAARGFGIQLQVLKAQTNQEIEDAFTNLAQLRAGGLVIGIDSFLIGQSEQLAALALKHRLPAVFLYRQFAAAGGLASYGGLTEGYRLLGVYSGRILKGEKPSDLPVQQPTKVELIINLKTAKALEVTVPIPVLGRADEVIE